MYWPVMAGIRAGEVPYAQCIIYPGKMTFSKSRETISPEQLPGNQAAQITMGHVCCVYFGLSQVATVTTV